MSNSQHKNDEIPLEARLFYDISNSRAYMKRKTVVFENSHRMKSDVIVMAL